MEYDKNICPVASVDGVIAGGKEFDLDITLPKDNRNVIYGIIKDCYKDPVEDAVVKLIEVVREHGKEERRPVSHTFTDKDGEFVFGPLCPDKIYEIQIWVDNVKHAKICASCKREGSCLKGIDMGDCKKKHECEDKYEDKFEDKFDNKYEDKCDKKPEDKYDDKCDKKHDDKQVCECFEKCECKEKCEIKKECGREEKIECKKECKCEEKCYPRRPFYR